jgi:protoheme IX farnesyltransferase
MKAVVLEDAPRIAVIARMRDYIALTKPRLNALVVATTAAGWCLGNHDGASALSMAPVVMGTTLVAAGAAALNQVLERGTDLLMRRTRLRPVPAGRMSPRAASEFGLALVAIGLLLLAADVNLTSAMLAFVTVVVYLAVYTPLKQRTPAATLVGAVPGALPPLIGWAGARGDMSLEGVALAAIVFFWQVPHFMAIAWLCRDDYRKAGFPMLPVIESDGRRTGRTALVYAAMLLPISLLPWLAGLAGFVYGGVALAFGCGFWLLAARFAQSRSDETARALFLGSLAYLPLLWIVMIADRA